MSKKNGPLWLHPNGQWCKKIGGKPRYFGTDRDQAIARYMREHPFLYAGQQPPAANSILADVLNSFHGSKSQALEQGRLAQRTFNEYQRVCDVIADVIGKDHPIDLITSGDFDRLRSVLIKGKAGKIISPTSQRRILTYARAVFSYANEECDCSFRYKKPLQLPSAKQLRKHKHETGERLFTSSEICNLLEIAKPQLRAMIYLGINCGFGNRDCATLPIEQVSNGWHNYWRPKTQTPRRCPLWPETTAALTRVVGDRTEGLIFRTKAGNPWFNDEQIGRDPISYEFRKLCQRLGIYRRGVTTFYSLRRTFYTIATTAGEPAASQFIMGHTPPSNDMGAVYRQRHFDESLLKVTNVVRNWLLTDSQSAASQNSGSK